jgi:S-adenosylmethionine-dependent methyltransferase
MLNLNNVLPSNSRARRKLVLLARHLNVAVTHKLRKNFFQPTQESTAQFREALVKSYLPSWHKDIELDNRYFDSEEGLREIDNHLFSRLELDRYNFVPWIDSLTPLMGASVLEIGCGTGSVTVALAEQGASVIAVDAHREALEISRLRAHMHGVKNVSFIEGNAKDLKNLVRGTQFDLIVFLAVLEHMNFEERKSALRAAWEILPIGKKICISDTPNRLWFYDGHTSELPFFNWLPDELAFEYSKHSPRYPFNEKFREMNSQSMLSFMREGRGFSFHDIDLALGDDCEYKVISDMKAFLALRNPAVALKRFLASDRKRERLLNSYAPSRHRAFFRQYLDLVIEKVR